MHSPPERRPADEGLGGIYKILVVDDEPDTETLMLQRMRRHIRNGRYEFFFAENGMEALDTLHAHPDIDIVLSDINMPEMDGLTLLKRIPKIDPEIRSVIMSAYGDMKNIRTAMNLGAFDFLTKPVDFKDLNITIERTLANMEEWREALAYRTQMQSLKKDLAVAKRIQQAVLPSMFPATEDYQLYGIMEPAQDVGGDFFDVIPFHDGRTGLLIADVSDKGIPAAMFMMACCALIKNVAIRLIEPDAVLKETNRVLSKDNQTLQFVTVLYALYDEKDNTLRYASGGHEAPMLVRGLTSEFLPRTGGVALGVAPNMDYKQHDVRLEAGDTIVLYTDGITDARDSDNQQFGADGLRNVFDGEQRPRNADEATRRIVKRVKDFIGEASQFDDITCLVLHLGHEADSRTDDT